MNDREKLIALIRGYYQNADSCSIEKLADHLISHGVVVREKGEWVMRGGKRYCPVCKARACVTRDSEDFWYTVGTDFCPHCGSDMRGAVNNG